MSNTTKTLRELGYISLLTPQAPEPPDSSEVPLFDKFATFTRADIVKVAGNYAEQITNLTSERDDAFSQRDKAIDNQNGFYAHLKREQSRAEQAEKKLAEVEMERNAHFARCQELAAECIEKDKELSRLSASPWIPVGERMPTEADAPNRHLHVVWGNPQMVWFAAFDYARDAQPTHWMPLPMPPLPSESPEVDPFEDWAQGEGYPIKKSSEGYYDTHTTMLHRAWKAALASTNSTK